MGNLIGFKDHLNRSTPFSVDGYEVLWKGHRQYVDFQFGNEYNETCDYPRFYNETGYPVHPYVYDMLDGCYDSDFDQYGSIEAFGVYPDWKRQLAKFASVQDRLREWYPSVRQRLIQHSCNIIRSLDIDAFRYDKATQSTVDPLGEMSFAYRECAREVGKNNFFLSGEITGGNTFGSIYLGRGRQENMWLKAPQDAFRLINESEPQHYIRPEGYQAIDGAAFHYSIYRSLTRFLGMDGNLEAGFDLPVDFTDGWETMLRSNDMINANTGEFDPRHMYGTTNQDVFRWPALQWGVERQLLGLFVATLHLPGIPTLLWGEEQAFYVLDSTAANYIYGRQSMSSATAWKTHGCYTIGSTQYYKWPLERGLHGCHDQAVTYDHRDPSHPVRNILKHMFQMREQFPSLNDGWMVKKLSNITEDVYYPGSNGTVTETGLWSVVRGQVEGEQDLGSGNQSVWLVYQNLNRTKDYDHGCDANKTSVISPFPPGTTVKNLLYPNDEHTLEDPRYEGVDKSLGCLDKLTMKKFGFNVYVPKEKFVKPRPMITRMTPGHDVPLFSKVAADESEDIPVSIYFSTEMDCDSVTESMSVTSSTETTKIASVKKSSADCKNVPPNDVTYIGEIPSVWAWSANLTDVYNGIHRLTVRNATDVNGEATNAVDHFLVRVGQHDNPMIFTGANYSSSLLHMHENGSLYIRHHAAGADKYRYSTNWQSTFSNWIPYHGGNDPIDEGPWSGTEAQEWEGKHVRVEYWNKLEGSSDYVQEGDYGWNKKHKRRFPHLFFNGPYNQYGFDAGLDNKMRQDKNGLWEYRFMVEWPAIGQVNVWGMNPDGQPDTTQVYGDVDSDSVLDRMPPSSLATNVINITEHPPNPYVAWRVQVDDGTLQFQLLPTGSKDAQMAVYFLLWVVPILTAAAVVYAFMKTFYQVKFNPVGVSEKKTIIPLAIRRKMKKGGLEEGEAANPLMRLANKSGFFQSSPALDTGAAGSRRTVLIATMEYDIEDWAIKIKIGGLGVMAQLMGKHLGHQNVIWVVPCVGGVDYPEDEPAESMFVTILGNAYEVKIQYHTLRNITYVLLDAPVFRQQTKSEPYPSRMDDLDSAIYYSAWNQCIAHTIKRFPVDLYHINDYHGSVAPLYLLPESVPICLSLHNAEFQGLWPMRTQKEKGEVCSVFNLDIDTARRYVQFGEVFNLLHAGASYLRVHQQGFGAVGVSKKYGKRSYARYPIFWGLKKVGNLPNPDPSDTGEWNKELPKETDMRVDAEYEATRGPLKRQAQEWAGLEQNPDADLMVFVGRWSMQKGVDLIADVLPAILETRPSAQLICVGPVIDLYGKFAALKLDRMMKVYPGRVFSKPQFTALPPFIFSGAEFALIPSRDEPFGLVAVEFGRKGALGIGARVGGLGQMPGWWYNVESTTTAHLLHQFKVAIDSALSSKADVRAQMRARSAKQRFPVAQWLEDLDILQSTSIRLHSKGRVKSHGLPQSPSGANTPYMMAMSPIASPGPPTPTGIQTPPALHSREPSYSSVNRLSNVGSQQRNTIVYSRDPSPGGVNETPKSGLSRQLSLGVRSGPGHVQRRGRRRLRKSNAPDLQDNTVSNVTELDDDSDEDIAAGFYGEEEYTLTPEQAEAGRRVESGQHSSRVGSPSPRDYLSVKHPSQQSAGQNRAVSSPTTPGTPSADDSLIPPSRSFTEPGNRFSSSSALSVDSVVGDKKDFKLQKVDPFFTDSSGEFTRVFEKRLEDLSGSNSESQLCIEEYLVKSEKKWFDRFRDARLGRNHSPAPSVHRGKLRANSPAGSFADDSVSRESGSLEQKDEEEEEDDEFLLGNDYVPPNGLKRWMEFRIGDWPMYSFLLGLGQIIAANSYQITLLTGEVGQSAEKLYGIATVYLVTSIIWWFLFRTLKAVTILSIPWALYGLAFLMIGLAHFEPDMFARGWIQNVASAVYAAASSSGSLFFALNFGDESGAPVKEWVFRACVIQGTQQAYVIGLWYWGSTLASTPANGHPEENISNSWKMTYVLQ
jgi:alpha-1,3-glucan synthase